MIDSRFISPHVAAKLLACSRTTIYRYIAEGILPAKQIRRRKSYRIPAAAIARLLDRDAADND